MRTSLLADPIRSVVLVASAWMALAGCEGQNEPGGADGATALPTATVTTTVTDSPTATATETVTVTETPTPAASPRTRDCGQVGFEPNTDAGAFDIRATGVDCQLARDVARAAEGQRGERYAAAEGFTCRPTGTVGELPSVVYKCTREGDGTVVFEAS